MGNCKHECYNCRNFQRYYVKKAIKYNKTKFGFCCKKQDNVSIHGYCEKFVFHETFRKPNAILQNKLDGLLMEISALRMIVEENEREYAEKKKL